MHCNLVIICCLYFIGRISFSDAIMNEEQRAKLHEKYEHIAMKCFEDNAITEDDMHDMKARKIPTGPNVPCFMACMMKAIGTLDNEGFIQKEKSLEIAKTIFEDPDELKNVEDYLHSCSHINSEPVSDGAKGCDRAMLSYKCMVENASKFGFDDI